MEKGFGRRNATLVAEHSSEIDQRVRDFGMFRAPPCPAYLQHLPVQGLGSGRISLFPEHVGQVGQVYGAAVWVLRVVHGHELQSPAKQYLGFSRPSLQEQGVGDSIQE